MFEVYGEKPNVHSLQVFSQQSRMEPTVCCWPHGVKHRQRPYWNCLCGNPMAIHAFYVKRTLSVKQRTPRAPPCMNYKLVMKCTQKVIFVRVVTDTCMPRVASNMLGSKGFCCIRRLKKVKFNSLPSDES